MLDFFESITFGFKTIFKWNMMQIALITGLCLSAIWILIGFVLWSYIVSFSSFIIELMPFSMVRSNGAWLISAFAWILVVLVTFALFVAFFGTLFSKKIPKEKYNYFYIVVITCSALFWTVIWFFKGNYLHAEFAKVINLLPFQTVDEGISYLVAGLIIYNAIIVSILLSASILSEYILSKINKEYFDDEYMNSRESKIIGYTIKDALIYLVASIVLFPLFFVPFLNFIVQIGLWTFLVRNTFRMDVGLLLFKNIDEVKSDKANRVVWAISLISVFFNFIPLLNVFGPYFGEISIFHYFKNYSKE